VTRTSSPLRRLLDRAALWGALALLAALPALASGTAGTPPASLQGTWELNPDLTAQLRKDEPKPSRGAGRQGGGGFGGHGRGGGGGGFGSRGGRARGGGDEGGGSGGARAGDEEPAGEVSAEGGLPRLTIAQQGDQVTITGAGGHARALKVGGGKLRDDAAPGGGAEVQASWDQDGSLLVDVKPDKGPHRTESYLVSNDRKHLYVTTTVSRRFQGDAKRVRAYDLVPAPAPEAAPAPGASPSPPGPSSSTPPPA
jgi:hypothetical protein